MGFLINTLCDVLVFYSIGKHRAGGSTAEEIYDTIELFGKEKPPREEFIAKFWEYLPKHFLEELREKRNKLLVESDWTQFRDVVLADDEAWKTYRQALRDLPSQVEPKLNEDMDALFPTKPGTPEPPPEPEPEPEE